VVVVGLAVSILLTENSRYNHLVVHFPQYCTLTGRQLCEPQLVQSSLTRGQYPPHSYWGKLPALADGAMPGVFINTCVTCKAI
jgi:hypothetical protein